MRRSSTAAGARDRKASARSAWCRPVRRRQRSRVGRTRCRRRSGGRASVSSGVCSGSSARKDQNEERRRRRGPPRLSGLLTGRRGLRCLFGTYLRLAHRGRTPAARAWRESHISVLLLASKPLPPSAVVGCIRDSHGLCAIGTSAPAVVRDAACLCGASDAQGLSAELAPGAGRPAQGFEALCVAAVGGRARAARLRGEALSDTSAVKIGRHRRSPASGRCCTCPRFQMQKQRFDDSIADNRRSRAFGLPLPSTASAALLGFVTGVMGKIATPI